MKSLLSRLFIGNFALLAVGILHAESRTWSNRDGKSIQAELVSYDSAAKKVILKLSNGKQVNISSDTLSDADQSWLTAQQQKIAESASALKANAGKTISYYSDGPEAVPYHVYFPTNYNPTSPPAMIIMFSPGGDGRGILGSVQEACETLGWIGVGCDVFRNNTEENLLDKKWIEVLPHIEKTVRHNDDLLYLGGMSGGALRAYIYSETLPRPWKGVLAFGGWLGGKKKLNCPKKMAVAIVNGDSDNNANAYVKEDTEVLKKARSKVKNFSFQGGHTVAPSPVVQEAMQWLKTSTVPGKRLPVGKRTQTPLDAT